MVSKLIVVAYKKKNIKDKVLLKIESITVSI